MKPEDRPAEAERIGGEVSEILEAISERAQRSGVGRRDSDHDWRRWLAEHLPAFFGVMTLLTMLVGALIGRVLNSDDREHQEFREAIKGLQTLTASIDRRLDSQESRLSNYGDDSARAMKLMTELAQERYETYRAQAIARGDDAAVRRINRKLQALNDGKAGGTTP